MNDDEWGDECVFSTKYHTLNIIHWRTISE